MASTVGYSDFTPEQINARNEYYKNSKSSKSSSHKRGDSRELGEMGAQFGHLSPGAKQTSWPRPPQIDIPLDDVTPPQYSTAGDLAIESARNPSRLRPMMGRSRGGSRSFASLAFPSGVHHCSEEDVAILRQRRDNNRRKMAQEDQSSEVSYELMQGGPPSMSEDCDVIDSHIPTHVSVARTECFRHRTPPPRSVTTTEDSHGHDKGPASPYPWSPYKWKGDNSNDAEDGDKTE